MSTEKTVVVVVPKSSLVNKTAVELSAMDVALADFNSLLLSATLPNAFTVISSFSFRSIAAAIVIVSDVFV